MPIDAAWKQATLASARRYDERLWLYCNGCHRSYIVMHDEFAAFHRLEPQTPFLLINKRLRCVVCGEKKGQCRSETHGTEAVKAYPVVGSPIEGPQPARRIIQSPAEPRRLKWSDLGKEQIDF